MPASTMCCGVPKSGSPISRWMTRRPEASSAFARASTSNAVSVPSRPMLSASRSAMIASVSPGSVAELDPPPVDVLLQLVAHRRVERRGLVARERLPPDLTRPLGRVATALRLPSLEVLGRGEQRPVEAGAEALQRVRRAEEVAAVADLLVGVVGQAGLVDLERREFLLEHAQDLDVDDELLVAADEARLQPPGRVHDVVRACQEGRQHRHERLVGGLRVDGLAGGEAAAAAPGQAEVAGDLAGAEQPDG